MNTVKADLYYSSGGVW